VQAFLGHANITTTSRYLQSAPVRLEHALARMEECAMRSAAVESSATGTEHGAARMEDHSHEGPKAAPN